VYCYASPLREMLCVSFFGKKGTLRTYGTLFFVVFFTTNAQCLRHSSAREYLYISCCANCVESITSSLRETLPEKLHALSSSVLSVRKFFAAMRLLCAFA
jgi:hypothetical protein